jgi:lactoylglutathione lyase
MLDEGATTCCYAASDKHWVTDPQGIAWEQFQTLSDMPTFSASQSEAPQAASACCPTPSRGKPVVIAIKSNNSCC